MMTFRDTRVEQGRHSHWAVRASLTLHQTLGNLQLQVPPGPLSLTHKAIAMLSEPVGSSLPKVDNHDLRRLTGQHSRTVALLCEGQAFPRPAFR